MSDGCTPSHRACRTRHSVGVRWHPGRRCCSGPAARRRGAHGRHVGVEAAHAGVGVGRLAAGDQPVQRRAQRVDVGPGALLLVAVLFDRREAGRQHHLGLLGRRGGLAGGAEVQQHQAAVRLADLDVVRLDVAVQEAGGMHHRQPVQQRLQQVQQLLLAAIPPRRPPLAQRLAALVLQHHVGGLVGFEEARHPHDVGVAEGRQRPGLDEEAVQPELVELAVPRRRHRHRLVRGAEGDLGRQVFLDCHPGVQVHVGGEVGDAETALAQHPVDAVLVQTEAHRQRQRLGRGRQWRQAGQGTAVRHQHGDWGRRCGRARRGFRRHMHRRIRIDAAGGVGVGHAGGLRAGAGRDASRGVRVRASGATARAAGVGRDHAGGVRVDPGPVFVQGRVDLVGRSHAAPSLPGDRGSGANSNRQYPQGPGRRSPEVPGESPGYSASRRRHRPATCRIWAMRGEGGVTRAS